MIDERGNTINYVNKEEIKKLKITTKKISLKDLYKKLMGVVSVIMGFITTNKLAIFLGGIGEDQLIKMLAIKIGELKGFLSNATYNQLEEFVAKLGIEFLEGTIDVISVVWNFAMANPVFATILISALIALGVYVVGNLAMTVINKIQKSGEIKSENKSLSM